MTITCSHCARQLTLDMKLMGTNTFINSRVKCDQCGGLTLIPDGAYQADERGIIRLLTGPAFTPEVLQQLLVLAQKTQAAFNTPEAFKPEEFKQEVNAIVPNLGDNFEQFLKSRTETMKFLICLIGGIYSMLALFTKKDALPMVVNNYNYTYPTSTLKQLTKKSRPGASATTSADMRSSDKPQNSPVKGKKVRLRPR